jgi:nucleoside-diphosphate-sugar epimerase
MRVAVVGATGVVGRNLVPRLTERGHQVVAVVRDAGRAQALAAVGAEVRVADILDAARLVRAVEACDAAVHAATSVPRPDRPSADPQAAWAMHDRIRREGTANLLAACAEAGVRRYVQQSVAWLHRADGDAWVDETSAIEPGPRLASAVEMEALVQASGLDWCVLRGGAFYGPGSGREEAWAAELRAGRLRLPGDGTDYVSLVHVVDFATAVIPAVEAAPAGSRYLVVDDQPVMQRELLGFVAARAGAAAPEPGGPPPPSRCRASNARIKRELGWRPAYPTYRSGLA